MTKKALPPSRTADQFVVRFPEGMRDQVATAAKENGRSMNAEILARIQSPPQDPAVFNDVIKRLNHLLAHTEMENALYRRLLGSYGETMGFAGDMLALTDKADEPRYARMITMLRKAAEESAADRSDEPIESDPRFQRYMHSLVELGTLRNATAHGKHTVAELREAFPDHDIPKDLS